MTPRRLRVVGHRGAAAHAPENTAASLRAGLAAGADAIEVDVGLSADGRAVLLHDPDLARVTGSPGALAHWTWERLSRLDAGSWFGPAFAREPLLDLDGALGIVRNRAPMVVELKPVGAGDVALARAVLDALERTGGHEGVTVSSTHWELLGWLRAQAPGQAVALTVGYRERRDPVAWAERTGAVELHVNRRRCSPALVVAAHRARREVIAYTVNTGAQLAPLLRAGVDGVFSDDPAAILHAASRDAAPRADGPVAMGIDLGSGGVRAVLADGSATVLASASVAVESEADPLAIASSAGQAIGALTTGPSPQAIGIAAQRSSLLVWRRATAEPLTPLLSWRAPGPGAAAPALTRNAQEVARRTGLTVAFPYGAIRLRALLDEQDLDLGGGDLVAGALAEWLARRLGAATAPTDPSLAQRTLLLDVETLRWDPELLAWAGIPRDGLGDIAPSTSPRGSAHVGEGVAIHAVAGDTGAAWRACLGERAHGGLVVLGTGGFVLVGTGGTPARVPGLLTSILWSDRSGPHYAVEGTVHGLAACLLEARRRAGLASLPLDLAVARAGAAARAAPVTPLPEGGGTPDWEPVRRFEVGDGDWTDGELMRGTVEALAERFGRIGALLDRAGLLPDSFTATGGLATLPHLTGAIARALRRPLRVDTRPERTATGAALLALDGLREGW